MCLYELLKLLHTRSFNKKLAINEHRSLDVMDDFSYASTPRVVPYQYCSLIDVFKENARKYPEKEIAIYRKPGKVRRSITNSVLEGKASNVASYLVQKGISKGDHVGILGPNSLEWIIAEIGIAMAGAVAVHLIMDTNNASHIQDFLGTTDCKALILDIGEDNEWQNVVKAIMSLYAKKRRGKKEKYPDDPCIIFMRPGITFEGVSTFLDIKRDDSSRDNIFPRLFPEDTVAVFPTSGTTGSAKWMKHSHFTLLNAFNIFNDGNLNSKFYNDRPFSWITGFPISKLCCGNTLVFSDPSLLSKSEFTGTTWNIIKEEKCTHAFLLPYDLKDLSGNEAKLADPKWRLQTITTGGEIINSTHAQVIGKFCEKLVIIYGSTETLFATLGKPIADPDMFEPRNVGVPFPGTEIKVVNADGVPTKREEDGKVLCRSRYTFQEIYKHTDLTSKYYVSRDGWIDTGDVGHLNGSNELIIKARVKELISRGGRKIIPSNVEEMILEMPHIKKMSVIGVPDKRLFEEVCACYVLDKPFAVSPDDVEQFCRKKLFTVDFDDGLGNMPTYFLEFEYFPVLFNGKLNKIELKQKAIDRLNLTNEKNI